ncbi:MAG: AAA family ATPase [Patescibacteria group bacterium]
MIVGHEELIRDLRARADRSALGHSWIIFGPRGVGKATVARALARYVETGVFEDGGSPRQAQGGAGIRPSSDAIFVTAEHETDSIGIDRAREIRAFLAQTPLVGPRRTVVIEAGERLTPEAQNALLKVAEEPPQAALIILVVDDPERLLPTIRSRFAEVHAGTVPEAKIAKWLVDYHGVAAKDAALAAKRSFGAPGFAWRIVKDEAFGVLREKAEKLLALPVSVRKAFVKELTDEEEFDAEAFLEMILFVLVWGSRKNFPLWHKVLELRSELNSYNLNPRLHLTALAQEL